MNVKMGAVFYPGLLKKLEKDLKVKSITKCLFTINYKTGKLKTKVWTEKDGIAETGEINISEHQNFNEILEGILKKALAWDVVTLILFEVTFNPNKSNATTFYLKGGQELYDERRQIDL